MACLFLILFCELNYTLSFSHKKDCLALRLAVYLSLYSIRLVAWQATLFQ